MFIKQRVWIFITSGIFCVKWSILRPWVHMCICIHISVFYGSSEGWRRALINISERNKKLARIINLHQPDKCNQITSPTKAETGEMIIHIQKCFFLSNPQYRTHNRKQQTTGKAHLNDCKHKMQLGPSAGSGSYYEEILYTQEIHLSWIPQAAGKNFIRTNDSAFFIQFPLRLLCLRVEKNTTWNILGRWQL